MNDLERIESLLVDIRDILRTVHKTDLCAHIARQKITQVGMRLDGSTFHFVRCLECNKIFEEAVENERN